MVYSYNYLSKATCTFSVLLQWYMHELYMSLCGEMHVHVASVPDHCGSNPCQNGAQCVNLQETYWCQCVGSYTGTNCEQCKRQWITITAELQHQLVP